MLASGQGWHSSLVIALEGRCLVLGIVLDLCRVACLVRSKADASRLWSRSKKGQCLAPLFAQQGRRLALLVAQ
ncbi:hypothetical protein HAX54_028271, partial [Datura stramonium]|nr:hypothetical protein [Datura stramonium]